MSDARFEDGGEQPLRLIATDEQDLQVLATLTQDAVFPTNEVKWNARRRQLALLINRFRWEDKSGAEASQRAYERVQSLLVINDVTKVSSQGFDRGDKELVLSLLSIDFTQDQEGPSGEMTLVLAGDGAIRCTVDCIEVILKDVTRPYAAPSRRLPRHPE